MSERILYQFCGAGDMLGGVQDYTNTLAGYMAEQDLEPHVFIGSADNQVVARDIFRNFDADDIHILGGKNHFRTGNGSRNPLGSLISRQTLESELVSTRPDLVHVNAPWMPHIGGRVLRMAQKASLPTVATYHIASEEPKTNYAVRAGGLVDYLPKQRLDAMIAVSDPAEDHLRRVYGYKDDVRVISNGVDVDWFAEAKPFEANEPYEGYDPDSRKTIVFVGRADPRKGLGELLQAVNILRHDEPDIQVIVCSGQDGLATHKDYVATEGMGNVVHFAGRVDDAEKARWFASADIAALPALGGESQGIVLMEAMAAGAHVTMGGDNPGYRSVLGELENNLVLVDPRRPYEFADKLKTVLNSPCEAMDIHVQQQNLVHAKYDSQVTSARVLSVYRSLL